MNRIIFFLVAGSFISSCTPTKKESGGSELNRYFSKEFNTDEPGGAVLVMKGEEIIFTGTYGLADMVTKEKITANTLFNTGSISKTFVSNTILMLAQENKLSLNDSLIKYFPDFKNQAIAKKVKIIHLLTHTSGLPDNRRVHHDSVFLLTAKDLENFAPILLNDSLLFAPGSTYEYSNPAFNGLALIIEKVTGQKWQDVVRERIFKPAGMKSSTITDGPYPETGVAHAYLKTSKGFIEKDYGEEPTFAAAGNGGVWSSVNELAQYEIAHRNAVFLSPEMIERSRTITQFPNWKNSTPPFIGLSWFIEETPDHLKIVSHTGTQGGFYCDYVSIPEKEIVYILLCNTPKPRDRYRADVLDILKNNNWIE